jgi:hypothetical protein
MVPPYNRLLLWPQYRNHHLIHLVFLDFSKLLKWLTLISTPSLLASTSPLWDSISPHLSTNTPSLLISFLTNYSHLSFKSYLDLSMQLLARRSQTLQPKNIPNFTFPTVITSNLHCNYQSIKWISFRMRRSSISSTACQRIVYSQQQQQNCIHSIFFLLFSLLLFHFVPEWFDWQTVMCFWLCFCVVLVMHAVGDITKNYNCGFSDYEAQSQLSKHKPTSVDLTFTLTSMFGRGSVKTISCLNTTS